MQAAPIPVLDKESLKNYRYARTTRTFLTTERTCIYNSLYYSDENDNDIQKFVYLPNNNIVPRVLTNACQVNMSCFLSFCLRYEIFLEGLPNLYMTGKHRLYVTNQSTRGIDTPLSIPSYLFVFAYKVCALCQRYPDEFSTTKKFETLRQTELARLSEEHTALYLMLIRRERDEDQADQTTGFKEITTFPIRDPNRYNDFIRQEDLFDRTKDATLTFDWCELGWILFKQNFHPGIVNDNSSLEPWSECVSLVNDREIPVARDDIADEDIIGHVRTNPDEFMSLTYDDLSLVIPLNHFILNSEPKKAMMDFYVVVPIEKSRLPMSCIEIPDPRINFNENNAFGIYVNKTIRSSMRSSIQEYFVEKFTSLSEERLRSTTIRSFLMQNDKDPVRRDILSKNWPNASLVALDVVHLLEKCKPLADFKIMRQGDVVDVSEAKAILVYNGDELLGRNETVTLSLCHSLRVPKPRLHEMIFCFSAIRHLVEFVRYLFFMTIEYEIFLPLVEFLSQVFETYELYRYFPVNQITEIRSYWLPRLQRRVQALNFCGLYTTTGMPVTRRVQLFKMGMDEEERKRLTQVVQKTTQELSDAMKPTKDQDLAKSVQRIDMLKARLEQAVKSLDVGGNAEIKRTPNDPFRHLYQSSINQPGIQSKNVFFNEPDPSNDFQLIDNVNKKLRASEERMSSSLFDHVIKADQASLITNLIEEKKEMTLKEKFKAMEGPIVIFMLIVAGSIPNMTLDVLYRSYPKDVDSFDSHFVCLGANCHKALQELNETIIGITKGEMTLSSMFRRTGMDRFRYVAAELASIFLLDIIGSSTYKSMSNASKTNSKAAKILEHLQRCWNER